MNYVKYDANILLHMNELLRHIFIKCLKIGFTAKTLRYEYQVQKTKTNIKESNQIYHQGMNFSNSATENKNIDSSRHCSLITVDLEQVHSNV